MKKKFEKAEVEIILINNYDLIMTDSGVGGKDDEIIGGDDNFF